MQVGTRSRSTVFLRALGFMELTEGVFRFKHVPRTLPLPAEDIWRREQILVGLRQNDELVHEHLLQT